MRGLRNTPSLSPRRHGIDSAPSDGSNASEEWISGGYRRRTSDGSSALSMRDDRKSHVGTLDTALDRADAMGWIIVTMENDWKAVFPD